jgi:hypothetical protein
MTIETNEANVTTETNVETKTITLTANGVKYEINTSISFSEVSREQLVKWAMAERVIALQRALRQCSDETLRSFEHEGYDVHATNAGQKPKTLSETKSEVKSLLAGMGEAEKAALLASLLGD